MCQASMFRSVGQSNRQRVESGGGALLKIPIGMIYQIWLHLTRLLQVLFLEGSLRIKAYRER